MPGAFAVWSFVTWGFCRQGLLSSGAFAVRGFCRQGLLSSGALSPGLLSLGILSLGLLSCLLPTPCSPLSPYHGPFSKGLIRTKGIWEWYSFYIVIFFINDFDFDKHVILTNIAYMHVLNTYNRSLDTFSLDIYHLDTYIRYGSRWKAPWTLAPRWKAPGLKP